MIELGLYQHYKGNVYKVLGLARHTETLEELVIYQAVKDGKIWARPRKMFEEQVLLDGVQIPRFKKINEK